MISHIRQSRGFRVSAWGLDRAKPRSNRDGPSGQPLESSLSVCTANSTSGTGRATSTSWSRPARPFLKGGLARPCARCAGGSEGVVWLDSCLSRKRAGRWRGAHCGCLCFQLLLLCVCVCVCVRACVWWWAAWFVWFVRFLGLVQLVRAGPSVRPLGQEKQKKQRPRFIAHALAVHLSTRDSRCLPLTLAAAPQRSASPTVLAACRPGRRS